MSSHYVPAAKGHDPSREDSKYKQPRWCPSSLTRTQKRRLQRLRSKKRCEQESRKKDDGTLSQAKPMTSPRKEWKLKVIAEPKVQAPILGEPISTSGLTNFGSTETVDASKNYPSTQIAEDTSKKLSPS